MQNAIPASPGVRWSWCTCLGLSPPVQKPSFTEQFPAGASLLPYQAPRRSQHLPPAPHLSPCVTLHLQTPQLSSPAHFTCWHTVYVHQKQDPDAHLYRQNIFAQAIHRKRQQRKFPFRSSQCSLPLSKAFCQRKTWPSENGDNGREWRISSKHNSNTVRCEDEG